MSYIENQSPASTVSVGGTPVTNPNFSSTTPAAPAGDVNVTWQVSGSSISGYVPLRPPAGTVLWSDLGNAAADLTLANGTFNTTIGGTGFFQLGGVLRIGGADTGISRLGAASLAVGNGTAGDETCWLYCANITANNRVASPVINVGNALVFAGVATLEPLYGGIGTFIAGQTFKLEFSDGTNSQIGLTKEVVISWTGTSHIYTGADTGISRLGAASLAIGNGTAGDFSGSLKLGSFVATAAAPTVAAAQIGYGSTTSATANTTGGGLTLPLLAAGYIIVNIAGTNYKVAYYAS